MSNSMVDQRMNQYMFAFVDLNYGRPYRAIWFLDEELISDHVSLLILLLLLFFLLLGRPLQKSLRLRRFKSYRGKIWQDCFSPKYASIKGVRFRIWRHTSKLAAITSFHWEKRCHLVSATHYLSRAYAATFASFWSAVYSYLFGNFIIKIAVIPVAVLCVFC